MRKFGGHYLNTHTSIPCIIEENEDGTGYNNLEILGTRFVKTKLKSLRSDFS